MQKAQEPGLFYKIYLKLSSETQTRKPSSCQTACQGNDDAGRTLQPCEAGDSPCWLTSCSTCGAPFTDAQAKPIILESSSEYAH